MHLNGNIFAERHQLGATVLDCQSCDVADGASRLRCWLTGSPCILQNLLKLRRVAYRSRVVAHEPILHRHRGQIGQGVAWHADVAQSPCNPEIAADRFERLDDVYRAASPGDSDGARDRASFTRPTPAASALKRST